MAVPAQPASPPDTDDLSVLRSAALGCTACDLYEPATQTVFGDGDPSARIMLVGEQPGDQEDVAGEPFVGPAGRLLDKALVEAGIDRSAAYVTNAVKHFHFRRQGKRRLHQSPQARHMTACRPWLASEYRALRPRLIVCLGATAAKTVLGPSARVGESRGAVMERDSLIGDGAFLVTIHPSAVLRGPEDDRKAAYDGLVADLRVGADYLAT
jgi:uracil-DNA glycosylase